MKHVLTLAKAGVAGILTCGTYGEGVLTTPAERIELIEVIRAAFDEHGFKDRPIFSGVSDNSVHGAISNACDAAKAGADAVLCTPPSYYKPMVNDDYFVDFYTTLADHSPIPVMIYNYPAVTAGIDLSSELMIKLAQHPNIIGAKYTCANVGKLTRTIQSLENTTANKPIPFMAFPGLTDVLVPSLAVGAAGAIAGPANIVPKSVIKVYDLFESGKHQEAYQAQRDLAHLDNDFMRLGIEGAKIYLQKLYGAPEHVTKVRCPSVGLTKEKIAELVNLVDGHMEKEREL